MKNVNFVILFLIFPIFLFGQTEHLVQPNIADPLSGAPNNFHFVYTNQNITQKNKLFLFFPGTGGVPFNYKEILKHAANLGYHSIGLTYPNSVAINQLCLTTTDTTCHSRARLEVFDGIDRHVDVNVDVNNCIERRTLKLLEYLNSAFPSEKWSQYYNGNQILWEKIIVSGHSQGGGHAGIISKIKKVDRVAMFAAMDWISILNRNADWITWAGQTPFNKYFGFTHQNDEEVNFNKIQITWNNYGMNAIGNIVLVDSTSNPYKNSQTLFTLLTPENDTTKFHGSVVADAYTPMNSGSPVFAPVWTYMINSSVLSSNNEVVKFLNFLIYPNPTNSYFEITCLECINLNFNIFSLEGQLMKSGKLLSTKIDISDLKSGIYILKISQNDHINTIKIIKD